jgi:superfamily I DNA/RNA helicase
LTAAVEDGAQRAAIDGPLDAGSTAIVGPAGTGKSVTLLRRAERALDALAPGQRMVLSAAGGFGVSRLRRVAPQLAADPRVVCAPLGDVALEIVADAASARGESVDLIADDRAAEIFEQVVADLFALEWTEFVSAEMDPEISGMRWPERFADAALRLIRKLRAAAIEPHDFIQAVRTAATSFYGRPPNFASPDLIIDTPPRYRSALTANPVELDRQRRRELDLAKIVERLYDTYLCALVARGCLTRADALAAAAGLLTADAGLRARWAERLRYCLVDDAQDLGAADGRFLRGLFGETLECVTLAGDPQQRTLGFAGPRAEGILDGAGATFALEHRYRAPVAPLLERAQNIDAEAAFVAKQVAAAIAEGAPPHRIAVIARSLGCIGPYVDALLARNVAIDLAGDAALYDFAAVSDALGALWALADPYRHDWLLRNLEAPWLSLADATIATLCAEPAEPQILLFQPVEDAEDERGRRWDRRRNLRLALNVVRGDRDADIPPVARERLAAFRAARRRWMALERSAPLGTLARTIFAETVLAGETTSATARFRTALVERLARDVDAFAARSRRATLREFLVHAERIAAGGLGAPFEPLDDAAVAVRSVEAAKGYEFDHVFVVDVRAGAFPRYYVPDAFLFSPRFGMIAKENAGATTGAARTAKYTYYEHRMKLRDAYNAEERRAFGVATTRAVQRLWVTASGTPTRGRRTPEFLEELRAAADRPAPSGAPLG